jgi:hypothetical protein
LKSFRHQTTTAAVTNAAKVTKVGDRSADAASLFRPSKPLPEGSVIAVNGVSDQKVGRVMLGLDVIITDTGRAFVSAVHSTAWVVPAYSAAERTAAVGAATASQRSIQIGDDIVAVGSVVVSDALGATHGDSDGCAAATGAVRGVVAASQAATRQAEVLSGGAAVASKKRAAGAVSTTESDGSRRRASKGTASLPFDAAQEGLRVCRAVGGVFSGTDPSLVVLHVVPFTCWKHDESMVPEAVLFGSRWSRARGETTMESLRAHAVAIVSVDDAVGAYLLEKSSESQSAFRGKVLSPADTVRRALSYSGGLLHLRGREASEASEAAKAAKHHAAATRLVPQREDAEQAPPRTASRRSGAKKRTVDRGSDGGGDGGGGGGGVDGTAAPAAGGDEEGASRGDDEELHRVRDPVAAATAVLCSQGIPAAADGRVSKRRRFPNVTLTDFDVDELMLYQK